MSEEIKTSHNALGLLMAECEQLRRDLAQAKADLEWGKSLWDWLRDMLPDSGLCLEIDTEDLMELAQKHGRAKRVLFDPEIHGFIEAEPGDQIWWWGDDVAPKREAMNNCKECDHLKTELAQAKAENARLAAAWVAFGNGKLQADFAECVRLSKVTLGDLLAPTQSLLAALPQFEFLYSTGWHEKVEKELDRLRSILHSNDNSEKVKP